MRRKREKACAQTRQHVAAFSYNEAADDVVLLEGFSKLFGHTLGCLFAFAGVCKGELFLACKTDAYNQFILNMQVKMQQQQ